MGCKRLRVGIFFDGTGNSRREKETFSNVAKLYDRYLTLEDEYYGKPKIKTTSFKCYFIGLFDTVGSFGIPGNDIDYKPKDPYEIEVFQRNAQRQIERILEKEIV